MPAYTGPVAMTTDMGADELKPIISHWIDENRKMWPPVYTAFMERARLKDAFEEGDEFGGFGIAGLLDEGDGISLSKPPIGDKVRFEPEMRQKGFAITWLDKEFNRINKVERLSKKLSRAMTKTTEVVAAAVLNLGFSSTLNLGVDGKPLFATDHVLLNGDIVSNAMSADLNPASYEAAVIMFRTQPDNDGTPLDMMPRYLVVTPQNEWNAKRILGSANYFVNNASGGTDSTLPDGTKPMTGATNVFQNSGVTVVVNPYIVDPDQWSLHGPKGENNLRLAYNVPLMDRSFDENRTENTIYSMKQSEIGGYWTFIGNVGSGGA